MHSMSHQTTNPAGVKALFDEDDSIVFVDVRTVGEHESGHVVGAYNVPSFFADNMGRMSPNPDFLAIMEHCFDKSKALILGCEVGERSEVACRMLSAAGFTKLVNMHGGFRGWPEPDGSVSEPGWVACGFPTSRETMKLRSYLELKVKLG